MRDLSEQHAEQSIRSARARLHNSRADIFALAHTLKRDAPPGAADSNDSGFPRSHIMRAITGERGRMVLGGAAIALAVFRPKVVWRLARFAPLLRPIIMRYLVPKLLG